MSTTEQALESLSGVSLATPGFGVLTSPSIGKLAGALATASGEFAEVRKSAENPFFKSNYADMAELIQATRPALSKNGLVVMQFPGRVIETASGWKIEMTTILAHSSGEWIRSHREMTIAKKDAQGIGSAETYARRYNYQAILSLAGDDDDGNASAGRKKDKSPHEDETNEEFDQRTEGQQRIADFQSLAIHEAIKRTGKTEPEVLAYLKLIGHERIEHLLRSEFQGFLTWANSTGKSKIPGLKPASQITPPTEAQKAMKRLFATANQFSIPEKDLKQAAYEKFSVDSMTKLSVPQLQEMESWVKSVAEAVQES